MLARLADRTYRWRWVVLAAWLVVFAAGIGIGGRVFNNLGIDEGFDARTESARTFARLGELHPQGGEIVAVADGTPISDPAFNAAVAAAAKDLRAIPGVATVDDYPSTKQPTLVASDGRATLIRVEFEPQLGARSEEIHQAAIARLRAIPAPRVLVGGGIIADQQFSEQAERDLLRGELIALPVMAVLLVVLIGGFLAAGLPVAVALVSIAGGLLLLLGVSELTQINEYSINVVTMFGLGLAVDYSLLILNRFREERAHGLDVPGAIRVTTVTAGRTVLFSGLTVAVSVCGLLVFAEPWLKSLGYAGVGVVLIAMLAAVTLIPAMLGVAGRRIKPAKPAADGHGVFYRISRLVQRRALLIVPLVAAALIALAVPFNRAELRNSGVDTLPPSSEVRQVFDTVKTRFPGAGADPILVLADTAADGSAMAGYLDQVKGLDGVVATRTTPLAPAITLVEVVPDGDSQGPQARQLVRDLRELEPGFENGATGQAAYLVDYGDSIAGRLPYALGLIALATLVLLFLFTGSVVVPVKAIVMGVLSLGATFGALVWVFQDGHLTGMLDFVPNGYVDITIPVLIFLFGFGLSMDYEVFLLSRIKEAWDATGDNDQAVAIGLQRSGRIVTAAAILITVVFLGFGASQLLTIKQVGIGLALAVILDATVVRTLLVPATMKLLGHWNWWAPRPLARLYERFGLHELPSEPVPPAAEPAAEDPSLAKR
jgi:putative drug exporter of the RND superfamily